MRSNGRCGLRGGRPRTPTSRAGQIEDFTWRACWTWAPAPKVRALPVPVPGLGDGQAAVPQEGDHDLRDHALAKAPWTLASDDAQRERLPDAVKNRGGPPAGRRGGRERVIDPDDCGPAPLRACVESARWTSSTSITSTACAVTRCLSSPVSRRGRLDAENLESKGNPWGMGEPSGSNGRRLDFDVPVVDGRSATTWSTCSGWALRGRAGRPGEEDHQAIARCSTRRACGSPCSGRPRPAPATRPAGWQRVRLLHARPAEHRDPQRGRCAHDRGVLPALLNTIANEYPQLGGNYESSTTLSCSPVSWLRVKLTPVTPVEEKITYHDPCFLAGTTRCSPHRGRSWTRSPGCSPRRCTAARTAGSAAGPAGARMWMEERIANASTPSG